MLTTYSKPDHVADIISVPFFVLITALLFLKCASALFVMDIKWDYNYYQPWSDNEWLVDKMLAILDENVTMQ